MIADVLSKTMLREVVERCFIRFVAEENTRWIQTIPSIKRPRVRSKSRLLPLANTTSQIYELARKAGLGDKDYTSRFLKGTE